MAAESLNVQWIRGADPTDTPELQRWAAAVGGAVIRQTSRPVERPTLEQLTSVSWNVHGTHGRILEFIKELSATTKLAKRAVGPYVLMLQEAFRQDATIPRFVRGMRRAIRTPGTNPALPDIQQVAEQLDLSLIYVPSMRNGRGSEDRGNAILSTLPVVDAYAFELPFRRERRVAIAASVRVEVAGSSGLLRFINIHLDTWDSPRRLYLLSNPRPDQARCVLAQLDETLATNFMVLGGDLNTFWPRERATQAMLRQWATSQGIEDETPTQGRHRIDYLFFRFASMHVGDTHVADSAFGSDHHPVIATFR